jgi:hypothetical protein
MVERRSVQESILDQHLGADQQRIAGEGGERLVGRVTVARGAKRQDLPAGLAGRDQEVDELVGSRTEVADAIRPGQRRRMEQDAACSFHAVL